MKAEVFLEYIRELGIEQIIGIPDSTLKEWIGILYKEKAGLRHYVPVNEGAAVAMAAGVYLSIGKAACVYLQNSGLGNAVNPLTSILNREVYKIPVLLVIGWRGEPGQKDEPQHEFMGRITTELLECLEISYAAAGADTKKEEWEEIFQRAGRALASEEPYAIVIRRNTFDKEEKPEFKNNFLLTREEAVEEILLSAGTENVVVSTTGKISREAYDVSERLFGNHSRSFLTVGGMGHASMIAFGISENLKQKRIYCLDGDGAVLMHMGSLKFIAAHKPKNYVHICLNNQAYESVGGMPTEAGPGSYAEAARSCGYPLVYEAGTREELKKALEEIRCQEELSFLEVKLSLTETREPGRPRERAEKNKQIFMEYHRVKK